MLTALVHACTGKMGAITSVVAELGEVKDKAKTFKWKEFKEYRGGVLVVSLTRLHKVMHTVHVVARLRCATPYISGPGVRSRALGRPYVSTPLGLYRMCAVL